MDNNSVINIFTMDKLDFLFVDNNTQEQKVKGAFPVPKPARLLHKNISIPISELNANMKNVIESLDNVFVDLPKTRNGFSVDEITVNLSVDVNGKISVLAEVGVGASASIEIKLRRNTV